MFITDIFFQANNKDYHIKLDNPIEGTSHQEIRSKAEKVIEEYMFENRIPGPYKIYWL